MRILFSVLSLTLAAAAQPVFTNVFPPAEYAARRTAVIQQIGDGVAILQGTTERPGEQPLRQSNQFFYLTGVVEPRALLVIDGRSKRSTLFLQPRSERREKMMFGPGLFPGEEAAKSTGIEAVLARDEFKAALDGCAKDARAIFTPFRPEVLGSASASDPAALARATKSDPWDGRGSREEALIDKLKAASPQSAITDLDPIIDTLRGTKSPREIAIIREATHITGLAIMEAMRDCRPGMYEYELQADAEYIFKKYGAYGAAYFALIATGTNTYYSHYHKNTTKIADGDLVQFDYAPDFKNYTSDVTRVFPANGKFTPRQREYYGTYLKLYQALMAAIKVHAKPSDIIKDAVAKMDIILDSTTIKDAKIKAAAKAFVDRYRNSRANSLGHTVGMEVHDVRNPTPTLEPGQLFTIEPAMQLEDEHLGIRLEDLILITENGYENLSSFIPVEMDDIEKLMAKKHPAVPQTPAPQAKVEYPIRPIPIAAVHIEDNFWRPRIERNQAVTIPHIMRQNELTGRVENFVNAAKHSAEYKGRRFNDTDVYKVIEAASYSLLTHPDAALEKQVDALIPRIAAAQEPDGYLFPARTINPMKPAPGVGLERWIFENGSHELYNSGHLYEAAVAHFLATGKRTLLDVAVSDADLVVRSFGPDARHAVPGHEEIELALVKMYRATNHREYLDTAKFFLDERGQPHDTSPYPEGSFAMYNDRPYKQDHLPVQYQDKAVGHAVRAMYLYAAMTDIAALFKDNDYEDAATRLWDDVLSKRLYLTGGVGARAGVEAFGEDYELPNRSAYTETCASVGNMLWNQRLFLLQGHGKYLDVAEQILYNGLLSGVSLSGDRFFYQNPLESGGNQERSAYFDVACCPANLARAVAQFPGMVYAQTDRDLYVNLYVTSRAEVTVASTKVNLAQQTRYPWDGSIHIEVNPERQAEFTLRLRIPGWSRGRALEGGLYRMVGHGAGEPRLSLNDKPIPLHIEAGFATITAKWKAGDALDLRLPMPVERVLASDRVMADRGRAALQRGPVVYCVEAADNASVDDVVLPINTPMEHEFRAGLLGGVEAITGGGVTAIPYSLWANRGKGAMAVWIRLQ